MRHRVVEVAAMRAPSCSRALTLLFALAASGCVGPFARGPAPSAVLAAHPVSADDATPKEGGYASPAPLPSTPVSDCDDVASEETEDALDGDPSSFDDGFESVAETSPGAATTTAPFSELTDAEIAARLKTDIGALGPMSIGRAHSGVLIAGVRMPEGANWELVSPGLAWGTQETVDALARAIDAVAERFPSTPALFIGNLSAKRGGHLPPHVSHQSGRDVDISYYLAEGHRWYATATSANLDRARTWHLIRTLIAGSDVDLILVDTQVQRLLKAYALEIGEDPAWLDEIFQVGGKSRRPLIFHAKGHASHLHVRFYSPVAQELGRRAYRLLLARRLIAPPTLYITHTVKPGETLSHLARRYKVTVDTIKKTNALKKDTLRANKAYKIPQTGGVPVPARLVVPERRVPPEPTAVAELKRPPSGQPCRRAALGSR